MSIKKESPKTKKAPLFNPTIDNLKKIAKAFDNARKEQEKFPGKKWGMRIK